MMYELTVEGVLYRDYPIQYPLSGSSTEKMEINEVLDSLFSIWIRERQPKEIFYQNLLSLLEIDLSSVWPHFEIKSETSLIKETVEEVFPKEMLEYNVVVRIPPKRRYTVQMRIKCIRRGEPKIVEPEGFL